VNLAELYQETITLPRAREFPVALRPPPGFVADRLETWPKLDGRLEYVEGRLLFMPPCGEAQQDTVGDVVMTLGPWVRAHPELVLATHEAGMHLGGSTRGEDVAIWRADALGPSSGGLRKVPPVLAVEVAGQDDDEASLRDKAAWYLAHGVVVVWLVIPDTREVVVATSGGDVRVGRGERLPPHPELPGLAVPTDELFRDRPPQPVTARDAGQGTPDPVGGCRVGVAAPGYWVATPHTVARSAIAIRATANKTAPRSLAMRRSRTAATSATSVPRAARASWMGRSSGTPR
jgi:Uma2 family endonuclease